MAFTGTWKHQPSDEEDDLIIASAVDRLTFYRAGSLSPMPLTTVYIPDADGREFATNVLADSIEEAVEEAVEFFSDRFWKGPKPKSGTVLRIRPMGGTERRIKLP